MGNRMNFKHIVKELEKSRNIRILFLVESGSREWGFASEDSDYDLRGVFIYEDAEKYLGITDFQQQIEISQGNVDLVLWDIRKFMKLFANSNPSVSEWLSSKTVYYQEEVFSELSSLRRTFKAGKSATLKKHYINLAKQNYFRYIKGREEVSLKKYIYILRAIGCYEWIKRKGTLPPMNYLELKEMFPDWVWYFLNKKVEEKMNSEKSVGLPNSIIGKFIEDYFKEEIADEPSKFNQGFNSLDCYTAHIITSKSGWCHDE